MLADPHTLLDVNTYRGAQRTTLVRGRGVRGECETERKIARKKFPNFQILILRPSDQTAWKYQRRERSNFALCVVDEVMHFSQK